MKRSSTVSGFVSGAASTYEQFWESRVEELEAYSPEEHEEITDYLIQQVFGAPSAGDEDFEDYEMQEAFNEAMKQKISARAAKKNSDGEGEAGNGSRSQSDRNKWKGGEDEGHEE